MGMIQLSDDEALMIEKALIPKIKSMKKGLDKSKHAYTIGYQGREFEYNLAVTLLNRIQPLITQASRIQLKQRTHTHNSVR